MGGETSREESASRSGSRTVPSSSRDGRSRGDDDEQIYDEKKLKADFKRFDADGNGLLSRTELRNFMKASANLPPKDLEVLINDASRGEGSVSFPQFLTLMKAFYSARAAANAPGGTSALRAAFSKMDKDGNGVLEGNEIKYFADSFGQKNGLNREETSRLLREADRNGDGKIDYEEFIRLITAMLAAKRLRNPHDNQEIREALKILDSDGNMWLTPSELKLFAMCLHFGHNVDLDEDRIGEIIREADPDGDGQVDLVEFERIFTAYTAGQAIRDTQDPDEVWAVFNRLDTDENGWIGRPEFKIFLRSMVEFTYHGDPITEDIAERLLGRDKRKWDAKEFDKIVSKLKKY